MNATAQVQTDPVQSFQVEWTADARARLRLAAWINRQTRDSKQFARFRSRQIGSVCLLMLAPVAMLAFVLSTKTGGFLFLFLVMAASLAAFALFGILRGGRLTPTAALRLAGTIERMGGLIDMSGRWRFSLSDHEVELLWIDHGVRTSAPLDRIDRVEDFEGELIVVVADSPIGSIPARVLTPAQYAALTTLGSGDRRPDSLPRR